MAVLQVTRRAADAVHFVESALQVGKLVKQKIDWERRLDHMQQHSGKGPSVNYTLYLWWRNQYGMKTSLLAWTFKHGHFMSVDRTIQQQRYYTAQKPTFFPLYVITSSMSSDLV